MHKLVNDLLFGSRVRSERIRPQTFAESFAIFLNSAIQRARAFTTSLPETILKVDLYGTALVLEEFGTSSHAEALEL